MPKPGDEDYNEEDDPAAGGSTVTVEDDPAAPAAGQDINPDEEEQDAAALKQLDNKAFAAMRKSNAEMKKQLEAAKAEREELARLRAERSNPETRPDPEQFAQPRQQRRVINGMEVPVTEREWDDLARKNWKVAVDLRSIVNAEKVNEEVHSQREHARLTEDSKQKVLAKHPELNDANTEKGRMYVQILRENPEYLRMAKGPIIAMREMEERMAEAGTLGDVNQARAAGAQAEAARQSRVALSATGGKIDASAGPAKTITLTKDEIEMCEHSGLDKVAYAKKKLAMLNAKKGAL